MPLAHEHEVPPTTGIVNLRVFDAIGPIGLVVPRSTFAKARRRYEAFCDEDNMVLEDRIQKAQNSIGRTFEKLATLSDIVERCKLAVPIGAMAYYSVAKRHPSEFRGLRYLFVNSKLNAAEIGAFGRHQEAEFEKACDEIGEQWMELAALGRSPQRQTLN